jgi:PAS domain S-box-containing protein
MSEVLDNYTKQKETIKTLIRQLHEGETVEDVQAEFAALLGDVGAREIAEIEQELIDEGMPETEIQRLCDVHVAVFRESLEAQGSPDTIPGHPVYTFLAENAAAGRVLNRLAQALETLKADPSQGQLERARAQLRELKKYEAHYLRKENILFPYLEKHGFSGPSAVMWGIHDEIREGWRQLEALLSAGVGDDLSGFRTRIDEVFEPLATAIREMFYKEENILYPASLEKLGGDEWWQIRVQSPEVGYSYVKPGDQWPPQETALETLWELDKVEEPRSRDGLLHLETGSLTPQVVNLILNHLPVEISFVDENDTVRFFTQTGERIFPRSPAVIGRKVQKCHPPASVHRVQQILDDFRADRRDEAEFWIQMDGRFIHIRYLAVRDDQKRYRGTLEVVQDVTHIRELHGERRLLDEWEKT